jgi:hypothetical protein
MSAQILNNTNSRFRIAWLIMVVLSAASAVNSFVLIFLESAPEFVVGWVAFNLFSTIVLLIPFRRGERWAWYSMWILALGFASVAVVTTTYWFWRVGIYYLIAGGVVALCLLATRQPFFRE